MYIATGEGTSPNNPVHTLINFAYSTTFTYPQTLSTLYLLCTHPLSLFIEDDNGKLVLLVDKVFVPYKQLEGILPHIQQWEFSSAEIHVHVLCVVKAYIIHRPQALGIL